MVSLHKVSKVYHLYRRPADRLREALPLSGGPRYSEFWALKDVSLQVGRGEILGIVGPN